MLVFINLVFCFKKVTKNEAKKKLLYKPLEHFKNKNRKVFNTKKKRELPVLRKAIPKEIKSESNEIIEDQSSSVSQILLDDSFWNQIENEFVSSFKEVENEEDFIDWRPLRGKAHKAVRIFVSSTFMDFFNERRVLAKQVS